MSLSLFQWQKRLANVADVFIILGEIQRTWSYLEPLFVGSDEVKRELPEDAKRFEGKLQIEGFIVTLID